MRRLAPLILILGSMGWAQTTTTVAGTLRDLTQALVTSGKVTYTLQPFGDTTISGLSRFSSTQVVCPIASTGNIVSLANSNVTATVGTTTPGTSVVLASATGFASRQAILIVGAGAAGANYVGTITGLTGTAATISPATSTSVNAGATVYDPCQITMTTAQNPPGAYYQVDVWPYGVKTSSFTFYAVLPYYDWSTAVPTPTTMPAQNFVDVFSNQTIGGMKTFTGGLAITNGFFESSPFTCVEWYMGNTSDYGVGINAAVQAQSLTTPSTVKVCSPGKHTFSTPLLFDRPIHFEATGSKLIPQASLASTPVVISNATVTAGSNVIAVSSTAGLSVGMSVGGLGITYGSYITAINPGVSITVSLMPSLTVNALPQSSTTVPTAGSLAGFAAGQTLTGYSIPSSTTISSIRLSEPQALVLSNAATVTQNVTVALSLSSGTWRVPTLTAVAVKPLITWAWNASALHNEFGQMIGGAMKDVWIVDETTRGIAGLQGIQIYGWDGFNSYNTRIEFIDGSGVVIGGNVPASVGGQQGCVRESFFYDTKVRYSGDLPTGQPAMEIITPYENANVNGDEHNELVFNGGQIVTNIGEMLTIGSNNPSHVSQNFGPGGIWFVNNFQIEGGSYLPAPVPHVQSQADGVHLVLSGEVVFDGDQLNGAGYGKSVIRADNATTLTLMNNHMVNSAMVVAYTVGVTSGSKNVTFISAADGSTGWPTDGSWNGTGLFAAQGSDYLLHLDPSGGIVTSTTMLLASNWPGTTGTATFSIPQNSYLVNQIGPIAHFTAIGNEIDVVDNQAPFQEGAQTAYVGWNPANLTSVQIPSLDNTTALQPGLNMLNINSMFDSSNGVTLENVFAGYMATGHFAQRFYGVGATNNNALVEIFSYVGAGSTSNYASWGLYGSTRVCTIFTTGTWACPSVSAGTFVGQNANPAASGVVRLSSTDQACWRNNANTADICVSKNAKDQIVLPPTVIGGGTTKSLSSGTASNSDLNGELTMAGGTHTYTFTGTYTSHPICIASDETAIAPVKVTYTGSTAVIFTTSGATDVVDYNCTGRN